MTADEYLYETEETNRPRELAHSILREPPAPFYMHQVLVLRVAQVLAARTEGLGHVVIAPIDVVLDHDAALIVQPDVLFVTSARAAIIRDQIWGAPDLVAEVLSPGTAGRDRCEKRGWYRQYGVREYWLVDPQAQQVTIVDFTAALPTERTARGDRTAESSVVPGLVVRSADIF